MSNILSGLTAGIDAPQSTPVQLICSISHILPDFFPVHTNSVHSTCTSTILLRSQSSRILRTSSLFEGHFLRNTTIEFPSSIPSPLNRRFGYHIPVNTSRSAECTMKTDLFTPSLPSDLVLPTRPRPSELLSPSLDVSSANALGSIFQKLPLPEKPMLDHLCGSLQVPGQLLRDNETVGFPTETVYGLGGNALSDVAIEKIYAAKGRPSDNPLIVHISDPAQLEAIVCHVPPVARRLIAAFWPGPLTLVLRHSEAPCSCPNARPADAAAQPRSHVSARVTAGLDTVAVRMPAHPVALALIRAARVPVAAPSANTSGRPSPTQASHVHDDLDGRIAGIVDGRAVTDALAGVKALECQYGVESTVVDVSHLPADADIDLDDQQRPSRAGAPLAYILRPGGVTLGMLEAVVGRVAVDPTLLLDAELVEDYEDADPSMGVSAGPDGSKHQPKAPGMKYVHYAPQAPLHLVLAPSVLKDRVAAAAAQGRRVGILASRELLAELPAVADAVVIECGSRDDMMSVAAVLYGALRTFDSQGVDVIFAETFSHDELGAAVMNRLLKAAGGKVIKN